MRRHQNVVHNFENHVFHAWEIEHFDDEFQTVLDGHPQVDIIFVIALATEHQVEIQVMWGRSVNLEMMYEIINCETDAKCHIFKVSSCTMKKAPYFSGQGSFS